MSASATQDGHNNGVLPTQYKNGFGFNVPLHTSRLILETGL